MTVTLSLWQAETVIQMAASLPYAQLHTLVTAPNALVGNDSVQVQLAQCRFPGLATSDNAKIYTPISSGSWSDFITWTTLKIHD